jgi:hypothetical protein
LHQTWIKLSLNQRLHKPAPPYYLQVERVLELQEFPVGHELFYIQGFPSQPWIIAKNLIWNTTYSFVLAILWQSELLGIKLMTSSSEKCFNIF